MQREQLGQFSEHLGCGVTLDVHPGHSGAVKTAAASVNVNILLFVNRCGAVMNQADPWRLTSDVRMLDQGARRGARRMVALLRVVHRYFALV